MRKGLWALRRVALVGVLIPMVDGLAVTLAQAQVATEKATVAAEKVLPPNTVAFVKVRNAVALREAFKSSQIGQLIADPAMKPFMEDLGSRMSDANKSMKEKLGVSIEELLKLPQGPLTIAVVTKDDPKFPVSILVSADAGSNAATMKDVMTKLTREAENTGGKVATEQFQNLTLNVVHGATEDKDAMPVVWTQYGNLFHIASDVDALKDLISNARGRTDSLSSSEGYNAVTSKVDKDGQLLWFLDVNQVLKLLGRAGENQGINAEQIEAQLQLTGLNGLKAAGGSFAFSLGDYDQVIKTFVHTQGPVQGLLKMFSMPRVDLRPEPWVPASVATYQTFSWDLDSAWNAVNELADQFAPGIIDNLEKQIGDAKGGLSFKKDIFGPLGNRVTLISDYKKPITEKSQRVLIAIALQDAKAFQNSLNKILDIAEVSPKKREFQGTTIFDFEVPELPEEANLDLEGPISVAIAKDYVFMSTEASILEQILRPGGPSLVESPEYQSIAKQFPTTASTLSYERSDEQARLVYNMVKGGQLQEAIKEANNAAGNDAPKVEIDVSKLPDFSVFAKYLSNGGGYGVMGDDGILFTQFTLKKSKP